jgi:hypothetical protein
LETALTVAPWLGTKASDRDLYRGPRKLTKYYLPPLLSGFFRTDFNRVVTSFTNNN